ncbi:cold shock domain-containing protein [Actinoallomurus vinaceus]|uniref:Cold shock domain-containing protein n=1 Tax=Actinoallomurus vinaceus TaxID=1080074 RepID=A0ABP8U930_9ACTN
MVRGRVVRFDEVRGYGFVAPDDGGEDVFVHANDLLDDKYAFSPGTSVEFEVAEGERGPKGYDVRLVAGASDGSRRGPAKATRAPRPRDDDGTCEILTTEDFRNELTEAFLAAVPELTAAQILLLRDRVIKLAASHDWIED